MKGLDVREHKPNLGAAPGCNPCLNKPFSLWQ